MAQIVKLEKPQVRGANPDGFILTETAEDIYRSLALVRSINGPAMTVISGAPGVGKTEALRQFERERPETAIHISIAKGEGNPFHVATSILNVFGSGHQKASGHDLTTLRRTVGSYLGRERILLVDEAQHLYQRHKESKTQGSAFGWLVAASEESGFDLVFCGDLSLQSIVAEFPHLQSRMRRPLMIKAAARADVAAMAAGESVEGDAEVNLLTAVAGLIGGLRNVENVLRMAAIFAGKGPLTAAHLKAAIQDLKLQPKPGK